MQGYEVKIQEVSRELSAKDRVKIKDTSNAQSLDTATADGITVVIDYDYHAILAVHNEKSENKDYKIMVVVDKAGNKFYTGSESFITSLNEILEEMNGCEEDWSIEVYRKESKNFKGKTFITCSVL